VKELSTWYNGLSANDKAMLARMLERVATNATFGFLCVLDGVRAIEDGPEKGTLKLIYSGAADTVLAGSGGPTLHELLE